MNATRAFFDTNILIYLFFGEPVKADACEALLAQGGVISVQVLNEFVSVAIRKLGLGWPDIREAVEVFSTALEVQSVDLEVHRRALDLAQAHRLNIYDAAILSAAERAGCDVLYTEDMHSGLAVGALTLANPFA